MFLRDTQYLTHFLMIPCLILMMHNTLYGLQEISSPANQTPWLVFTLKHQLEKYTAVNIAVVL